MNPQQAKQTAGPVASVCASGRVCASWHLLPAWMVDGGLCRTLRFTSAAYCVFPVRRRGAANRRSDPIEMSARDARELLRCKVREMLFEDAGHLRQILELVSPDVRAVLVEVISEISSEPATLARLRSLVKQ